LPDLDLKLFIPLGLALGGVYSMSGVGLLVLYRATGVLNLAYGAVGAVGALISWSLLDGGTNQYVAYAVCILFGGVVTLLYGLLLGPPFAAREPLIKATATIGLALILLGLMQRYWEQATVRTIRLPTTEVSYTVLDVRLSRTHLIGMAFPIVVGVGTAIYLRTARSPPCSASPSAESRRPPGSARGSWPAWPVCSCPTSSVWMR
jgi:branched-chain amino acid transport system permease protein